MMLLGQEGRNFWMGLRYECCGLWMGLIRRDEIVDDRRVHVIPWSTGVQ